MDQDVKWYRVVDPISPLFGCDVRLSDDSAPVRDSQKGGRKERKHHEKKVRLKMVEGENKSSAMTTEEKKNLLKTFKVIK